MVAGRAAWAKKRKRKAPAKATLERRAREARKKKAAENVAAEEADAEASAADEAMEKFVAAGLRARQDPGHVKVHRVGLADMAARADAVCDREAWENAMEIMRERKSGWVHARDERNP